MRRAFVIGCFVLLLECDPPRGHTALAPPVDSRFQRRFLAQPGDGSAAVATPREMVVLLHGMGRTRRSMLPLERALQASGYEVLNYSYPSRRNSSEVHGRALAARLAEEEKRPDVTRIHMVGHSLGNIVIRWVLAHEPPAKAGRVVMLAPPNRGSPVANLAMPWLTWFSRPLPDLTTHAGSAARTLATPPGLEIGVIAGSLDHLVRPKNSCLEGQTDHIVVRAGHTFIMTKPRVHDLAITFLRTGSFGERDAPRVCGPRGGA